METTQTWKHVGIAALKSVGLGYAAFFVTMIVGGLVPVVLSVFIGKIGGFIYVLSTCLLIAVLAAVTASGYVCLKSLGRRAWQGGMAALLLSPILFLMLLVIFGRQKESGRVLLSGLIQDPASVILLLLIFPFGFGALLLLGGIIATAKSVR